MQLNYVKKISAGLLVSAMLFFAGTSRGEEPELMIVKYGSLLVKSTVPDAKVYVDNTYKGGSDSVIESIMVGDHVISCKAENQEVSGTFSVKKNETLRLEARFEEGRLAVFREPVKQVEVEKKPEPVKPPQDKQKKPVVAETKKIEQKNPVEERRKTHLNVMRIDYEVNDSQAVTVNQTANSHVIAKYSVVKNTTGKYYRTKQGMLLCDAGPCEITWTAKFLYTDDSGKSDALLLNWKETVFNGITPSGTSRQDLECCLNGQCWKMQENKKGDAPQEFEIGRYRLIWSNSSVLLRRSDIIKEILDAGRSLSDY